MNGVSFRSGLSTEQVSTGVFRIDDAATPFASSSPVWNAHPELKVVSWSTGGAQKEMLHGLLEHVAAQSVDVVLLQEVHPSNSVAFTMSKVQYQDVKRQRGKAFVEVEVNFTASANATDAASGYSPIATVTTNNISTAYVGS